MSNEFVPDTKPAYVFHSYGDIDDMYDIYEIDKVIKMLQQKQAEGAVAVEYDGERIAFYRYENNDEIQIRNRQHKRIWEQVQQEEAIRLAKQEEDERKLYLELKNKYEGKNEKPII
jgi:hypothetical protein